MKTFLVGTLALVIMYTALTSDRLAESSTAVASVLRHVLDADTPLIPDLRSGAASGKPDPTAAVAGVKATEADKAWAKTPSAWGGATTLTRGMKSGESPLEDPGAAELEMMIIKAGG